jgi:thiosulfate/3-mercaptopyruvate sulfurtransferase
LEPWEKVLVSAKFFDTEHGTIDCQECHGGKPAAGNREAAHEGVVRDPTINAAPDTCGECHEEIVETGVKSLHATLSTFHVVLKNRSSDETWEGVNTGRKNHCAGCHSSCGQCHVSRPKFAKNGFINGHLFEKRPSTFNQCTACHGSRVGDEYFGNRGMGDLHASQGEMDCVECHGAEEMHASGEGLAGRYHLPEIPKCQQCHEDLKQDGVEQHALHVDNVQCQVCHSQDYVNCYSCHTGKDEKGLAYFQNEREVESFKIGKAYPGSGSSEKYILVRHAPSDLEVFDHYIKDGFTNFGNVPTWKRTSPHNIQRKTWRNQNCNHCHGQRDLFLSETEILDYEKEANAAVVVADSEVPTARTGIASDPAVTVVEDMVVTAEELHDLLAKKAVVLVDARSRGAFKKGHIEGAICFSAGKNLRHPPGDTRVMTLKSAAELAEAVGKKIGIDGTERVVIYDKGGLWATLLFAALERLGLENVSILDGGLEGWHEAGYHLAKGEGPKVTPKTLTVKADEAVMASNAVVSSTKDKGDTILLDVRNIAQHAGLAKSNSAKTAGKIKGSVNLSVRALWSVEGFLKDPAASAWLLESQGITKDKTIITTCNSSQLASGAYFALKYLGYDKVKLHDGSWINWEASPDPGAGAATPAPAPAPVKAPPPPPPPVEEEEEEEEDMFGC